MDNRGSLREKRKSASIFLLINCLQSPNFCSPVYVGLQSLYSQPLLTVCLLAFSFLGDGGWKLQNPTSSQSVLIGILTPALWRSSLCRAFFNLYCTSCIFQAGSVCIMLWKHVFVSHSEERLSCRYAKILRTWGQGVWYKQIKVKLKIRTDSIPCIVWQCDHKAKPSAWLTVYILNTMHIY